MLSTFIFAIALLGLVVLFGLKSFELARNVRTPLHHIRRVGDPLVQSSWTTCSRSCRTFSLHAAHTSTVWTTTTLHKTHLFFDGLMHRIAARLNRYLRGRRFEVRHNGTVSSHLKTVLEKTNETTRSNPL